MKQQILQASLNEIRAKYASLVDVMKVYGTDMGEVVVVGTKQRDIIEAIAELEGTLLRELVDDHRKIFPPA